MIIRYAFAMAWLLLAWHGPALGHVFYVSIAKVKWNPQQQRIELSIRLFTSDLEQAVEAQGGPKLNLWTPREHPESNRFVAAYLTSRLHFRIDGQVLPLEYTGKADALDATACFLQIRNVKTVRTIEIDNQILLDLFEDQTNVVQFEVEDEKKFVNLNKRLFRETVTFKQ
jgi:uncharacterized protein YuzE